MIWLARHGETTWNLAGRYQGRLESALSALGMRQALALADAFGERVRRGEVVPERVVSSPLLRCAATARVSADRLGVAVHTDDRLIEIAHGTWDGRYRDDLAREEPERYHAWRSDSGAVTFTGGESLVDVRARWRAYATELARDERPTLVVTHDAVVRCALLELQGKVFDDFWNVRVENAAFALLETDGSTLSLIEECVTDHLAGARADTAGQAL